jgi:outer membrane protein OmpA-like peptidoglycan-associated protein
MKQRTRLLLLILIGSTLGLRYSHAQDGIGLPFLKIGIGARQAGMGEVFTGVGDDVYTLFWNPGGMGHLRRWQWSLAYNRWFSDIYQASAAYATQFRLLGSRKTTIGLSCAYLGMPSWDSTGGLMGSVSAGHFMAVFSLGQRLDWISRRLALGVNVKMISSRFDSYTTSGVAADFGLLYKSKRFRLKSVGLGLFDYGIITFGGALLHYGGEMKVDTETTLLPQTWRVGMGFHVGRYRGLSLLLASDVIGVKGRDWALGLGSEVWWKDFLGARIGYRLNGDDLGGLSFGMGLRWDNVLNSVLGLPSRYGDAFELNLAGAGYGDILKETYRGSLSHLPVAPEPFHLEDPQVVTSQILGNSSSVVLEWEKASDPDAFDEVQYLLFIDKDRSMVERAIRMVERDMDGFLRSSLSDSLLIVAMVPTNFYQTSVIEGGIYHWAVAAYDLDHHARLASRGKKRITKFVIATPDLRVESIVFHHSPWITETSEQGELHCTLINSGSAPSGPFRVLIHDVFIPEGIRADTVRTLLLQTEFTQMEVNQDTTFRLSWETMSHGLHWIEMHADPENRVLELDKDNNRKMESVVSIPKGRLFVEKSVDVVAMGFDVTEIPVIPEVYFDLNAAGLKPVYTTDSGALPSVLYTISDRLHQYPNINLEIMGSVDEMSDERDLALSTQRAQAVRNRLMEMGVSESQLTVVENHTDKVQGRGRRPEDHPDSKWIMEQNRKVIFKVSQEHEVLIFGPLTVEVDTTLRDSIPLLMSIVVPAEIDYWYCQIEPRTIEISRDGLARADSLWGRFLWDGTDMRGVLVPRNQWYQYGVSLTDTLGRTFKTRADSVYLNQTRTIRRREIFGAAKFAQVEPVYQFYWDRLMQLADELAQNPKLRITFEGHACGIGTDERNFLLSQNRARRFSQAFKERVRTAYPGSYQSIWRRIENPVGYGEKEPLSLKLKGKQNTLLGDNETPRGRYLNRRITVLLYTED